MDDEHGHDEDDVLYIAFPGSVSQTVHKHADWAGESYEDFYDSIVDIGYDLLSRL